MRVALQVAPVEEAVEAPKVDVVASEEGPEPPEPPMLEVATPEAPEAPELEAATPEEAVEAPTLDATTPELEEATDEEVFKLELEALADVDCLVGTIGVREGTGERMGFEVEATLGSDEGPTAATVEEDTEGLPEPEGFTDELA